MKSISKYLSIFITLILISLPLKAEEFKNDEPVYHIVLIWLKTYRNEMRINKIINASKELKNIPGVLEVTTGKVLRLSLIHISEPTRL